MNWNPNENDPWGKKNSPPDLDDAIKQLRKMFTSKGGDGKGPAFKFSFKFFTYLFLGLISLYVLLGIRIVNEADRLIVLTLGKYNRVLGPGLQFHFPIIEEVYAEENVSKIRTFVLPTNMLTKDENINLRNIAVRAAEMGVIFIDDDGRTVRWNDAKKEKIITIPYGENVYSALAVYFKTDEGLDTLQAINNSI